MQRMVLIFIAFMLLMVGCSETKHVAIEYLDIDQVTDNVQKWLLENRENNGIYLAKEPEEERIYIYVNYSNEEEGLSYTVPSIRMEVTGKTLIVKAVPHSNENGRFEKVFVIKKLFNQIELNQEKIQIGQLKEL